MNPARLSVNPAKLALLHRVAKKRLLLIARGDITNKITDKVDVVDSMKLQPLARS